jgi:poly(A) polymerase
MMSVPTWPTILDAAATEVGQRGEQAWIVGGCLRDALLGWAARDVDLALTGDPTALAHALALRVPGAAIVPLPHGVRAVRVVWPGAGGGVGADSGAQLDLAALRGATIIEDLATRDFTINALALPVAAWPRFLALARDSQDPATGPELDLPDLVDPLGGLVDVRARVLRVASAHALADDPLRMMRGARLAAWLGLTISAETAALARTVAPALGQVAPERLSEELWGLLGLPTAADGLEWLRSQGALAAVLPELWAGTEGAEHAIATLATLDAARADLAAGIGPDGRDRLDAWYAGALSGTRTRWLALRWATLLHDLAPHMAPALAEPISASGAGVPHARGEDAQPGVTLAVRTAKRMGLAARERALVRAVTAQYALPAAWAAAAVDSSAGIEGRLARRYFARTGEAGVDVALVALACARARARAGMVAAPLAYERLLELARHLATLFLLDRERVLPSPLVNGSIVAAQLGVPPGPWLGRVLAGIRAAQVEGTVTTQDEALRLAAELYGAYPA